MAGLVDADVVAALRTVAVVEDHVRSIAALPVRDRLFLRFGKVCVAAALLARLVSPARMARTWRQVRGVSDTTLLALVVKAPLAQRLAAPVRADLVVVKSGLRAIYADQAFTLKIANPRRRGGSDRLRREIEVRRRLRDTDEIRIPALLDAGETSTTAYLVEAFVEGSHRERRLRDPRGFAGQLLRFALHNGAGARPLAEVLDLAAEWRRFRDGAVQLGYRVPGGLEPLVHRVRHDQRVLWGLCHGDLSAENLFDHGGSTATLVDWEHAREDPIFADVAKLSVGNPAFRTAFLVDVAAWAAGDGDTMLDPATQLALGGMVAVNRRADWIYVTEDQRADLRRFQRKAGRLVEIIEVALAQDVGSGPSSAR